MVETSSYHGNLTDVHRIYRWEYANAAARTGATGFVAADIGKVARQTDDNTLWMLTAVTPTWTQVGGAPSLQRISSEVLAGDGAFADVSIPSGFSEIWVILKVRTADAGAADRVGLRVGNGTIDTGTNYTYDANWTGNSAGGSNAFSGTYVSSPVTAGNGIDAGVYGELKFIIYRPDVSAYWRNITCQGGVSGNATYRTGLTTGAWKNTTQVINILNVIGVATATFKAGSSMDVVGVVY